MENYPLRGTGCKISEGGKYPPTHQSDPSEHRPQLQSRFASAGVCLGKIYDTIALHRVCTTALRNRLLPRQPGDSTGRMNTTFGTIWYLLAPVIFRSPRARGTCCSHWYSSPYGLLHEIRKTSATSFNSFDVIHLRSLTRASPSSAPILVAGIFGTGRSGRIQKSPGQIKLQRVGSGDCANSRGSSSDVRQEMYKDRPNRTKLTPCNVTSES
uniref:Uncharacterized protein n=1 Tax=Anopheles maculatus TaxID=74869 RepID=A0A182S5W3_9DIPT